MEIYTSTITGEKIGGGGGHLLGKDENEPN
jgi:hypothetical protein